MKTYTAAVVGLSQISQGRLPKPRSLSATDPMPRSHVSAYAAHPRVKLVGACDLMPAAREKFNATWREASARTITLVRTLDTQLVGKQEHVHSTRDYLRRLEQERAGLEETQAGQSTKIAEKQAAR